MNNSQAAFKYAFSRTDTIQTVKDHVCKHWKLKAEAVKLYEYGEGVRGKVFNKLERRLSECGIHANAQIMVLSTPLVEKKRATLDLPTAKFRKIDQQPLATSKLTTSSSSPCSTFVLQLLSDPELTADLLEGKLNNGVIGGANQEIKYSPSFSFRNITSLNTALQLLHDKINKKLPHRVKLLEKLKKEVDVVQSKLKTIEQVQQTLQSLLERFECSQLHSFIAKFEPKRQVELIEMDNVDVFGFMKYIQLPIPKCKELTLPGDELKYLTHKCLLEEFGVKDVKQRILFKNKLDLLEHGQLFKLVEKVPGDTKLFNREFHKSVCSICSHDTFESFNQFLKEEGIHYLFDEEMIKTKGIFGEEIVYLDEETLQEYLNVPRKNLPKIIPMLKEWRVAHKKALMYPFVNLNAS